MRHERKSVDMQRIGVLPSADGMRWHLGQIAFPARSKRANALHVLGNTGHGRWNVIHGPVGFREIIAIKMIHDDRETLCGYGCALPLTRLVTTTT